jgi:hypothetical protein
MNETAGQVGSETRPWKPALVPYRPRPLSPPRPKRALPGQQFLPGMAPRRKTRSAGRPARSQTGSQPAGPAETARVACPNCGGTQFDSDGDCTRCWEPGVGPRR